LEAALKAEEAKSAAKAASKTMWKKSASKTSALKQPVAPAPVVEEVPEIPPAGVVKGGNKWQRAGEIEKPTASVSLQEQVHVTSNGSMLDLICK